MLPSRNSRLGFSQGFLSQNCCAGWEQSKGWGGGLGDGPCPQSHSLVEAAQAHCLFSFPRIIAMMSPEDSWVSKWQRVSKCLPLSLSWPKCIARAGGVGGGSLQSTGKWPQNEKDGSEESHEKYPMPCHLKLVAKRSDCCSLRVPAFLSFLA